MATLAVTAETLAVRVVVGVTVLTIQPAFVWREGSVLHPHGSSGLPLMLQMAGCARLDRRMERRRLPLEQMRCRRMTAHAGDPGNPRDRRMAGPAIGRQKCVRRGQRSGAGQSLDVPEAPCSDQPPGQCRRRDARREDGDQPATPCHHHRNP